MDRYKIGDVYMNIIEQIKLLVSKLDGWCNIPDTGVHIDTQPSIEYVREWKESLEKVLKQLEFEEKP